MTGTTVRVAIAGLLACSGCGGSLPASVQGTVTLAGRPLDRGNVAFHPAEGGAIAYGSIQDDGRYAVSTGRLTGLQPGEYSVCVVATAPNEAPAEDKPGALLTEPGALLTPARYGRLETTDLRVHVAPGRNTFDLELREP